MINDNFLTIKEVSEYLKMSIGTLYNKVSQNQIPFYRVGKRAIRFKKDEIDSWIKSNNFLSLETTNSKLVY